jgi:VanZ family protein
MATALGRGAAWLLLLAVIVLSVVPPALRPETAAPHKLEHFAAFFVTGLAFGFGYSRRPLGVALGIIAFCGLIEFAQIFVPGRHARLSDFLVDAVAAAAGIIVAAFTGRRLARPPEN